MHAARDSQFSSYREILVEHLLLAELLKVLWKQQRTAEILKPTPGHAGYDAAIDCGGHLRYVQIKSSLSRSRVGRQNIHTSLARYPGACVVWVVVDSQSLEIKELLWYGGRPGQRLPGIEGLRVAKHTKANVTGAKSPRPAIRELPKTQFRAVSDVSDLAKLMFGV